MLNHDSLMARLGHKFKDPKLLKTALTHRSYFFENREESPEHFERFEFLGDAVLSLVVSETLMLSFAQMNEGALSKWRASLVNEATLSEIAGELQISDSILLGKSEEKERSALRPRLMASVLEALIAALYLDGGLEVAKRFVERCLSTRIKNLDFDFSADGKTRLQELTQKHFHDVPRYVVIKAEGPEHAKTFEVEVLLKDKVLGSGQGSSRKAAEQASAQAALANEEFLEMLKNKEVL